jgi:phosphoribosylformylglycinamidine (FGAM) synthase-like enzyme
MVLSCVSSSGRPADCPSARQGLFDPRAMARLALGEALTNLVWARTTSLRDVKASVNWMYAAKMGREGADMYHAAVALRCVRGVGRGA